MGHFRLSDKARATVVAFAPVGALGWELGHCAVFARHASEVRALASEDQRADEWGARFETLVDAIATRYARRGSAGHQVIVAMLERAADRPTWTLVNALMTTGPGRGWFGDPPLAPGEPRYWLQHRTAETYHRGAQVVAWRGAGRCLYCGVAETRQRPFRTDGYCVGHRLEHGQEERDRDAMRTVFRGAAEALGIKSAGKRSRRLRRSPTPR